MSAFEIWHDVEEQTLSLEEAQQTPFSFSDPEERRVFFATLDSFRQYRSVAHYNVTHRRRQNLYALPTAQWQMLSAPPINYLSTLEKVDEAIDANGDIADQIVKFALQAVGFTPDTNKDGVLFEGIDTAKPHHIDKARSTIRQMYRDWSQEGSIERQEFYDPVLQDLNHEFSSVTEMDHIKVLVPGAGLGRLIFEICCRGYTVEGNEISWHQLLASNWILNHTGHETAFKLFPFVTEFSNVVSRDKQLKVVEIPDVDIPGSMSENSERSAKPREESMNMTAGDFIEMYARPMYKSVFNAVVTVFFIDTAPNLIKYIETVHNCLRPGGIWINNGPLLWHYENRSPAAQSGPNTSAKSNEGNVGIDEPGSFELTDEEVILLVEIMGFNIEKHKIRTNGTGYIGNPDSMLQNLYRTSHWVARKKT